MTPAAFRQRARHEALRYGSDPWIFVRELLQNARDAGAGRVLLSADETDGRSRIACDDDGAGMTLAHARRYLFALYASSKEGDSGAAGRFGVGFWSVLRFEPSRILVRSWPANGEAWELELDGELTRMDARMPAPRPSPGTEIVLERDRLDGDLERRVRDAAWQSARFLQRRDDRHPLDVRVNGAAVTVPFDLPVPSASFRKGRLRGVVALGPEARVELFAKGLRVRASATVEDLLSADGSSGLTRVRFPTLADGVAPQAILDGDEVEPLLARADVRETPALRRLVRLAQEELRRLVERQLDVARPPRGRRLRATLIATVVALMLLGGAEVVRRAASSGDGPSEFLPAPIVALAREAEEPELAYRDFHGRYSGPRVEVGPASRTPVALRYEPAAAPLYFAALVLDRPFARPPAPSDAGAYAGVPCAGDCIAVRLRIDGGPGPIRLPVPTGHRIDADDVRLDGRRLALRVSAAGEPLVVLDASSHGVLTYGVREAIDVGWRRPSAPAVPPRLSAIAESVRRRPAEERVSAALAWVHGRIAYSVSAATAEKHRAARAAGRDALESALDIGAADCDVQNAVLTALLQAVDVPARLAVGYVGVHGVALAPPHAWVEVRRGETWVVVDASAGGHVFEEGPLPPRSPEANHAPAPAIAAEVHPAGIARPDARSLATAARRWAAGLDRALLAWLAGGVGLVAGAIATALVVTRTRRVTRVSAQNDIAALLRGALERPEAFRHVPALYHWPLIPRIDGALLSLADVARLSEDRRLFRSAARSSLARRAAAEGAVVLDAGAREGRAAADAGGAVDLDEWDLFLRRARHTPLLDAVERRLQGLGEPWQLRAAPGIGDPAVLDLASAGSASRLVVLDADAPWLAGAEGWSPRRRAEATFVVVDRLAEVVRLTPEDRRRVLAPLAREALREAAGAGGAAR